MTAAAVIGLSRALKMDKFVIRTPMAHGTLSDSDPEDGESIEPPPLKVLASSASYNSAWKMKYPWVDYDATQKGMIVLSMVKFQHKLEGHG
jgi:hypothetical protein